METERNNPHRRRASRGSYRGRLTPQYRTGSLHLTPYKMERFMREMERDMGRLDENNPKHMAHMMRKMQEALPPGMMPKEMNEAIRRLEAGEDPEAIEADMGEIFDDLPGSPGTGGGGGYTRDGGLYDL